MAQASDPDGDRLTYSWSAPKGTFNGSSNEAMAQWRAPSDGGRVTARVEVSDGRGGSASATVSVEVGNRPPAFRQSAYAFELRENADGRRRPVELGTAGASDADGDGLTYVLASGDSERFAIGARDGAVTYVGPGEDFETEPNRYELTTRVRDAHGATARARVAVTVTNVNEPPGAVDDQVTVDEDQHATVDVLANDTDPDGDRLRVEAVSSAVHGTTEIAAGGVTYTPEPNFHGADRFTYVVADGGGETATATVEVTVLPVNDAPEAVGTIPDVTLEEGGEPVDVEVAPYFTDVDGDTLHYTAESSDPAATSVEVTGSTLTLSAVAAGGATVTVTATDAEGVTATQTLRVIVADGLVREVLTDTLAALGRGHLSSVRQAFGRRLGAAGPSGDAPRLTLAGRAVGTAMWDGGASGGMQAQTWTLARTAPSVQRTPPGLPETAADRKLRESGGPGGFASDWSQALSGTDMLLAFGDGRASGGEAHGGGWRWTLWGQGDRQAFREAPQVGRGYEGDLRTGYLGVDAQVTRRWLLGAALARSAGTGTWQRGGAAGRLSTTLTRVHPYVRWTNGDTAIWATAGGGRGTATHVRTLTGTQETSPLSLSLGLLEGRRRVATLAGGIQAGVRGEASWARLATGAGEETVDALAAEVRRARGGIELARPFDGPGDLTVTAFGAASARRDGGAGPTGAGLETAGGLRLQDRRLQLEAQGRRLLLHSAASYEEHGVSLAASLGAGPHEPGLTLSVRPTWGADGGGAETLWQDRIERHHYGADEDGAGVDARVGYGLRLPGGGMLRPFGAYLQREHRGRRLQFGALLGPAGRGSGRAGPPLQLEIAGERYDRPGGAADHRFSMVGVLHLDGGKPAPGNATVAQSITRVRVRDEVDVPQRLPETAATADAGALAAVPEEYTSSREQAERPAAEIARHTLASGNAGRPSRSRALAARAVGPSGVGAPRTGAHDVHFPPVALPDTARTLEDSAVEIDVLANDRACGGLQIVAVTAPGHGTATVRHGKVRYVPARGYRGLDAFNYTVAGEDGRSAKARVTVGVQLAHRSVVRQLDRRTTRRTTGADRPPG